MSIEVISINGKCDFIDYDDFEFSLKKGLEATCKNAKVFLFNNFPVTLSNETNIDLLIIISIKEEKGNYFKLKLVENNKAIYLHNLIIPVKYITTYENNKIEITGGQINIEDEIIDYSNEIFSLKKELQKYLANKCGFIESELYVQPLMFIKNKDEFVLDNYLISNKFNYINFINYLKKISLKYYSSYKLWNKEFGFENINIQIEQIVKQAAKDSDLGYLTKNKIERISNLLSSSKSIFNELNSKLVIISGKAGTGKSSELLLSTMKCINNGQNTLYLTYNKLLIFDISRTLNAFINSNSKSKLGEASVLTLHKFFYRLSKSLGVLKVLSEDRIQKIDTTLKERMRKIYNFLNEFDTKNGFQTQIFKDELNKRNFDIGTKNIGIDFINYISKYSKKTDNLKDLSAKFYKNRKEKLINIETKDIFLIDYYGVLENTLLAINNPQEFYIKHNIKDKSELLETVLNLNESHLEQIDGKTILTSKSFEELKKRHVGGFKRKRTLFVDEAQDCHPLEKEILISIYKSDNIVIANGGKEQLIRHNEVCNWEISKALKIESKKYNLKNKSYRVKKTVVDFCNFIADKYNIEINLEGLESEDEGEIIFDFRNDLKTNEIESIFNNLKLKGEINSCTSYESIMVLLNASTTMKKSFGNQNQDRIGNKLSNNFRIDEYNNIQEVQSKNRNGEWIFKKELESKDFLFWDGTIEDKSTLNIPFPNESRVIYYESCRGLEAWSVACFSIDVFFWNKQHDDDAEKHLIEEMFLNTEERKNMYAAKWIIMAITRVIDTLYLQIDNENSDFGKLVKEYISLGKKNIKVLNR